MKHTDPRLDVLQAAVVAIAATLAPNQAQFARAALAARVADLEGKPSTSSDDAAAAATLGEVFEALDWVVQAGVR